MRCCYGNRLGSFLQSIHGRFANFNHKLEPQQSETLQNYLGIMAIQETIQLNIYCIKRKGHNRKDNCYITLKNILIDIS
jgi:hypothetical protein